MSIKLAEKRLCTGCAGCNYACSRSAISMVADEEGFLYPSINPNLCVNCGACVRACPALKERTATTCVKCYAAKSKDGQIVAESSSGGIFSELANQVIKGGGVVFGAAYDENTFTVRHIAIDSVPELRRLRGSKYVQSDVGDVYHNVKRVLCERRTVLFSGTPCQIAALRAFLNKDYENLFLVDVICHGVPSAKLFGLLKSELEAAHGKLCGLSFRDKSDGWRSRAITGWYEGVGKIREHGVLNDYFRAFIAHLTLRHSCETCTFNAGRSGADITLGDFWGVEKVLPKFDKNTGVSAVIVHTEKGAAFFSELKCDWQEVKLSDITAANPSYSAVRKRNPFRNKFMKQVWGVGISRAYAKYCGESLFMRVRRTVVRLFK